MVLRVGVARHVLTDLDPRVGEVFDDVHGTGTAALGELRRLVAVLRDPDGVRGDAALTAIEPSALPAAIGAAIDRARQAGITVEADLDPAIGSLDAVRGMAVLRLTQEALTNVAKHAGTSARGAPRGRRPRRRRALGGRRHRSRGRRVPTGGACRPAAGTASPGCASASRSSAAGWRRARPAPGGGCAPPSRPWRPPPTGHRSGRCPVNAGPRPTPPHRSRRDPGAAGRRPAPDPGRVADALCGPARHRGRRGGRQRPRGDHTRRPAPSRRRRHGPAHARRRRDHRDQPDPRRATRRPRPGADHVRRRRPPLPRADRRRLRVPAQGRAAGRAAGRHPPGGRR